jgi:hypothetical protein
MLTTEEIVRYTKGCGTTTGHGMSCCSYSLCKGCGKAATLAGEYKKLKEELLDLQKFTGVK